MMLNRSKIIRLFLLISLIASQTVLSTRLQADTGTCGTVSITLPFNDVMGNPFFCQIAAAYYSGLTNGTTSTTYSPSVPVPREQMAAFVSRTLDQSLKRGNRRVVTRKWWVPQDANSLTLTNVGTTPQQVEFDGTDLWVANSSTSNVMRIRASDGKLLDTWTGATNADSIISAMGRIFVTGFGTPGRLYMIDTTQPVGAVTQMSSTLGNTPRGIAFDGSRIWTANTSGSVSIVSFNPTTVTTVTTGFSAPEGIIYDGANIWVTDRGDNTIKKLTASGIVAQTIAVEMDPRNPVFDGTNIWVPNNGSNSVTVVRVKDAQGNPLASVFVLATRTNNGLTAPVTAAFDGERILITNSIINSVSLWKAADLSPLGAFPTGLGTFPFGACSDGLNFWVTLQGANKLARF